ncbi:MAG TPA: hypothetical protein GX728_04080 [Clostridiaceae bacterium]|nr:hypothetical protein [Clostridiaceae bacterium]
MQEIINALARRLKQIDETATIYQDDVEQGVKEPCFFITPLITVKQPRIMKQSRIVFPVQITYLPKKPGDHAELIEIQNKIMTQLEQVDLGSDISLRVSSLISEIVAGTLQVTCNLNYSLVSVDETDKFETLEGVNINGG